MDEDDLTKALKDAQSSLVVEEKTKPKSALDRAISAGYKVFAENDDGTILVKSDTGEQIFISPSYVTSDPQVIAGIMEGITPAETNRATMQDKVIEKYPIASRAASALQDVPFVGTYTDEVIEAIYGKKAGDATRLASKAVKDRNPKEALALGVTAGLASAPAIIAATPLRVAEFVTGGASVANQMMRGAAVATPVGASEGAISGYGRDGEMLDDSIMGGGIGGLTGGLFPAVSASIKALWQNVKGRSVAEIARTLGITVPAAKVVRTALENDDLDAAQTALERAGSSSMLADAGPATQDLLDVSVTSGGNAPRFVREAVEGRAEEAGDRMTTVLDDVLGIPEGVGTARRNIREGTKFDRDATYKDAYSKAINYAGTRGQTITALLKRVPPEAITQANKLMKIEGLQSKQILAQISDSGDVVFTRLPDVRQLDYITRALKDVADAQDGMGKLGGTTTLGRATAKLQRLIRKQMRREVPEYGVALDTAADAIQRINAIDAGYSILNSGTTRDDLREALRGFGRAEIEAASQGLRSSIDDTLARVNAVASDANVEIREFQKLANNLRSRSSREKMQLLLGRANADRLYEELDEAVVSLELRAAISRNSATQRRIAIDKKTDEITAAGPLATLASGEPVNAGKRLIQVMTGTTPEARALRKMGIYDEIASVFVGLRGRQAQDALRLVQRAMDGDALNETQAKLVSKVLTSAIASGAYSFGTSDVTGDVTEIKDAMEITAEDQKVDLSDKELTRSLIEAIRGTDAAAQLQEAAQ